MIEDIETFLTLSTIHGLAWIPISKFRILKLFWLIVVSSGFVTASYLIVKSFRGWDESPIATSVEVLPISEITFPNVTVCPPKDTFTILNYDLAMAEGEVVSEKTRKKLLDALDEAIIFAGYKDILNDFNIFVEKDRFRKWYTGISRISFPYWTGGSEFKVAQGKKIYKYYTYASTGEFITPYYQELWTDEKFEISSMYYSLYILRPWNDTIEGQDDTNIIFDIEQDMLSELPGSRWGGRDISFVEEQLTPFKKSLTVLEKGKDEYNIYYDKILTVAGLQRIKRKRIPGMKVSWRWDKLLQINQNFLKENGNFIRLVDIIEKVKNKEKVWSVVRDIRLNKQLMRDSNKSLCIENMNKDSVFIEKILGVIETNLRIAGPTNSVNRRKVSDENLNDAAEIYIYLTYCPNPDYRSPNKNSWVELYKTLFNTNKQQSIILSLSRIISEVEPSKAFEYNLAKELFEEVWTVFKLRSKDVTMLTSGDREISQNLLLKNHYDHIKDCLHKQSVSTCTGLNETMEMYKLVNHPVHITDRTTTKLSPSSFIPFCEFGSDASIMGKRIDQFDFHVCDSFEEIIFEGQLCYQVNVEKIKQRKIINQDDLKIGLTLMLDYNFDRTLRGRSSDKTVDAKNTTRGIVYFSETEEALVHIETIRHFKLSGLKEIVVTESFLGMQKSVIKCQNIETFDTCNTRSYLQRIRESCSCIPFSLKYHTGPFKSTMCTPKQLDCVKNIPYNDENCLPQCNGVFITNVEDNSNNLNSKVQLDVEKLFKQYEEYEYFSDKVAFHRAFKYRDNLQLVRLYIDTPVFDKITKDQSSKLEDRISSIGGNLGLLTGFSIISMIEVVYVACKVLFGFLRSKLFSSRPSSNQSIFNSNVITVSQTLKKEKEFPYVEN